MADIHSATADIRRGKKERRRKKKKEEEEETTGQKYNGLPYSTGRPYKTKRTNARNARKQRYMTY